MQKFLANEESDEYGSDATPDADPAAPRLRVSRRRAIGARSLARRQRNARRVRARTQTPWLPFVAAQLASLQSSAPDFLPEVRPAARAHTRTRQFIATMQGSGDLIDLNKRAQQVRVWFVSLFAS